MGYEHVDQVLESEFYQNPEKAVLVALAQHINNKRAENGDTEVWAGTKRLMVVSGCSYNTVRRSIKRFEADGVVKTLSVGDGKSASHYTIHLDKLRVPSQGTVGMTCQGTPNDGVASEGTPHDLSGYPVAPERVPGMTSQGTGGTLSGYHNQEYNQELNPEEKAVIVTEEEAAVSSATVTNLSKDVGETPTTPVETLASLCVENLDLHPGMTQEEVEATITRQCKLTAFRWEKTFGPMNGKKEQFLRDVREIVQCQGMDTVNLALNYAIADSFWSKRIHTPKGFITCLRGDLINQYRLDNPESSAPAEPDDDKYIEVRTIDVDEL